MPKNFKGTNTKAVGARERRAAAESDRVERKEKEEADAYWRDDDKQGAKKQQRKAEKEDRRQDQLERKKELAAELALEESSLTPVKGSAKNGKITQAQIRAEAEARQQAALVQRAASVDAESRGGILVVPEPLEANPNQMMAKQLAAEGSYEARSVGEAIGVLGVLPLERAVKATYSSFEAARLPQMKLDNPGLRQSQLRQQLRKEWGRSPENPQNQEQI